MARVQFVHRIEFPDNHGITLVDISDVLLAHEKLVSFIPQILQKALPDLTIEKIEISLVEAQEGSLAGEFLIQVYNTYQTDIQGHVLYAVKAITGVDVPEQYRALVTLLILALVFYGGLWLVRRVLRKDGDPSRTSINGDYNQVINITASKLEIPPDQLREIIEDTAKGPARRAIARAAQRFLSPAKRNGTGKLVLPDVPDFPEVSRETIREVPSASELDVVGDEVEMRPLQNVRIQLRAMDIDRLSRGWAGTLDIEEYGSRRYPLSLVPTIDPNRLMGAKEITADVMLEIRGRDDGTFRPVRVHVYTVHSYLARGE